MIKSAKDWVLRLVLVTLTSLGIWTASCSGEKDPPEGILSTDQMIAALSEVYLAEQKISTLGIPRDSLRLVFGAMEDSIFASVNTTDSVFRKSLNYYMERPQTMEYIYTVLIDSLNLREQRFGTERRQ